MKGKKPERRKYERKQGQVRRAKRVSPTIIHAGELWKRDRFTDAVRLVHQKLGIRANYLPGNPQITYNRNAVIGHPELVVVGRDCARKSIDLHNKLMEIPSRNAVRAMDKMPSEHVKKLFGDRFVEPMPKKEAFEQVAGTKISDARFKQMLESTTSRDLLSSTTFEILIAFGEKSDIPRLKQVLENGLLYHWHGYAETAIKLILQRG